MTVRRAEIERQNAYLLARQREFRAAADVVASAWRTFAEVSAVALIGSTAKQLWKEVPRFQPFRHHGIELWHECKDLDLAVWVDRQDRLGEVRRARDLALRQACESGAGIGVANHQVDTFLFEPGSDRYLDACARSPNAPRASATA
jgi:hypothetical protein